MKTICLLAAFALTAASSLFAVAPSVTTEAADRIGPIAAMLNCTVNFQGLKGELSFEFGTVSGNLDQETIVRRLGSNVTSAEIPARPLTPNTQYFFRAKAKTDDGTAFGSELDFTTTAAPGGGVTLTPRVVAVVGQPVTGGAVGENYAALKLAQGPFGGKLTVGKTKVPAIFAGDGSVRIRLGAAAPGIADSVITKLGEPSGDAALAKLKPKAGAVTAPDSDLLLAGLTAGPVRVAARTGVDLSNAAGVSIKKFGAIDGHGSVIFFLAKLQGASVTPKDDTALCAALGDGSVRVIVRKGQTVGATNVGIIAILIGLKGTLAEGRWRVAGEQAGVRITAADKTHHFFIVPSTSNASTDWTLLAATGDPLSAPAAGAKITAFGLPGFGSDGPAVPVLLEAGIGGVAKTNDTAVIRAAAGGLTVLAQEGSAAPDPAGAPLPDLTFKAFGAPISGKAGLTAFTATLNGANGAAASGIWHGTSAATLKLLARGGEAAPGGGKFAKFSSLALPDGATSGPIFAGKLAVDKDAGITAANNLGIWAVNTNGILIGLLRTGDQIAGVAGQTRKIKSFRALESAPGSIGAANGYDDAGKLAALVTFTDKTIALVEFTIP